MSKHLIPYIVIAGLLVYIFGVKSCDTPDTITTIDTDSTSVTTVDSLQVVIDSLETLPPDTVYADTVIVDSTTSDTTEDGSVINTIHSSYSDSLITARWVSVVAGQLIDQEFSYITAARPILRRTITKYVTTTNTITTTVTKTKQPGPYLSAGLLVGGNQEQFLLAPQLGYTVRNGTQITVGYDLINEAPLVGVHVKISLRKLLPF